MLPWHARLFHFRTTLKRSETKLFAWSKSVHATVRMAFPWLYEKTEFEDDYKYNVWEREIAELAFPGEREAKNIKR